MPPKHPFLLYLRSRLSFGLALSAAALIVLSVVLLGRRWPVPALVVIAAWALVTVTVFFSRKGAEQIVKETEEDRLARTRRKIEGLEEVRRRISVLRLGDERMAKAIEYFLQESGSYLEKCRELSGYSPLANERIERVLEICQVFLGERDEESTGRRYGVPGAADAPSVEATEGLVRDITECVRVIKERTVEDLLGMSGKQHLEITKELDDDK